MTQPPTVKLTLVSGVFFRIVWQDRLNAVLSGVLSPEGRLHHSGQKALYISPTPQWAAMAVNAYLRYDDPPRALVELDVTEARVADLRDPEVCEALGITVETAGVLWQPERAEGKPATSWQASDAVRRTEADGLIYPARSYPDRWHLVLHRWNEPGEARVADNGRASPWPEPAL